MQLTQNDFKQLPSNSKLVGAVMHNNQHYVAFEIIIAEQTIKVFDGLSHALLGWKDHIITEKKKCMLVDCSVGVTEAQSILMKHLLKLFLSAGRQ
jgi:hypothetical protein